MRLSTPVGCSVFAESPMLMLYIYVYICNVQIIIPHQCGSTHRHNHRAKLEYRHVYKYRCSYRFGRGICHYPIVAVDTNHECLAFCFSLDATTITTNKQSM